MLSVTDGHVGSLARMGSRSHINHERRDSACNFNACHDWAPRPRSVLGALGRAVEHATSCLSAVSSDEDAYGVSLHGFIPH